MKRDQPDVVEFFDPEFYFHGNFIFSVSNEIFGRKVSTVFFSNSRGYGTEVLMGIEVGCTPYDCHTSRRNEYDLVYRGDISTGRLGE